MSSREEHGKGIERGAAECHRTPNEVVGDKNGGGASAGTGGLEPRSGTSDVAPSIVRAMTFFCGPRAALNPSRPDRGQPSATKEHVWRPAAFLEYFLRSPRLPGRDLSPAYDLLGGYRRR